MYWFLDESAKHCLNTSFPFPVYNNVLIYSSIVKALVGAFNKEKITRYSCNVYMDVESEELRTLVNINIPVLGRGGETQ